jgi:hypothetical protein
MARIVLCMSNVPGRLHHRPSSQPSGKAFGEMLATGAVIVGRRTFDLARGRGGDQHPEDELTAGSPPAPPPGNRPGSGRTQEHARSAQPRTSSRARAASADPCPWPVRRRGPVRGRPRKADGPPHRSQAPVPVRYASVDSAT